MHFLKVDLKLFISTRHSFLSRFLQTAFAPKAFISPRGESETYFEVKGTLLVFKF